VERFEVNAACSRAPEVSGNDINDWRWWWWWWLMFYGHFCAQGRLNGPSDFQM
jgi:hypothetical protein